MNHQERLFIAYVKQANALTEAFEVASKYTPKLPGVNPPGPGILGQLRVPGRSVSDALKVENIPFGWADPKQQVLSTTFASVPQKFRGMGLGRKLYGSAIRTAYENRQNGGLQRFLTSDAGGHTSDKALGVWDALKRRGYPVLEGPDLTGMLPAENSSWNPRFGLDLDAMGSFYKDRP